jgi:hypothetical protein
MNDKEFLTWIYNRLIQVHNENAQFDYMNKLRCIIDTIPESQYTPNVFKGEVFK